MQTHLPFILQKEASGSQARAATFQTLHGEIQTPIFMPVGTQATVKAQTVDSLKATGTCVLLVNTYHLLLRPGPDVFKRFGGIHQFMNWDGPVLTDSGGFQIFSLPHARAMNEDGARFQSYVDGKLYLLSPESSIAMQQAIGSDIDDGARPVHLLDYLVRASRGGYESHPSVGQTLPKCQGRFTSSVVWYRAGRLSS